MIDIIHHLRNGIGPIAISRSLKGSESTIRPFLKANEKQKELFHRRGRPTALPPGTDIADAAMDKLEANRPLNDLQQTCRLALDCAARMNGTLPCRLYHGHYFYDEIGVCDLTKAHKSARVQFCAGDVRNEHHPKL
jgi:hypothetical protein